MARPVGPTVDVHAHFFPRDLPDLRVSAGDARWPVLEIDGDEAKIVVDGVVTRRAGSSLWDVGARVAALDAVGVDVQVISPVPIALVPWAPIEAAMGWVESLNEGLADAVRASSGRLAGLGAVPLGPDGSSVAAAVAEARRIRDRGLVGVEMSTLPGGRELDDPALDPFWAALDELRLPVLVHPTDTQAVRRAGQPYEFGIGMLTDTALAGSALLFGGVLGRFPRLRIALCHGCGALPWTFHRSLFVATRQSGIDLAVAEELVGRLWTDTLVFDPEHLRLVTARVGVSHLMLGTDDPMVPGRLQTAETEVREAVLRGVLPPEALADVLGGNALRFLGFEPERQ